MIKYTEEQKAVFDFVANGSGNGMINAVAGAGKTTTLLEASRYVPNSDKVLFCAFNKSVASEIKQRARNNGLINVDVHTVHALGWKIINEKRFLTNTSKAKYQTIVTSQEKSIIQYLDRVLEAANVLDRTKTEYYKKNPNAQVTLSPAQLDKYNVSLQLCTYFNDVLLLCVDRVRQTLTENDKAAFRNMARHYGIFKNLEMSIPNLDSVLDVFRELTFKIIDIGVKVAEYAHEIDFIDMLYLPYIWDLTPICKYSFCFVDECQDLAKGQIEIIKKCLTDDARVLAVGDPNQSICGFSGADTKSFQTMRKFLSAKELPLTGSFRCARKIIQEAQSIRPVITGIRSEEGIVDSVSFQDALNNVMPGDLVIARRRDPLVFLALLLIESDVPVRLHANELPQVLSEMKFLFYRNDLNEDMSLKGQMILESAKQRGYAEAERRYRKVHNQDLKAELIGAYRDKIDQYIGFISRNWNKWDGNTLNLFFYRLEENLSGQFETQFVRMLSIYSAKGLEEDKVFILDYDNLPFVQDFQREWEKEQEQNLKYVAVTRSKDELYLVHPLPSKKWESQLSLFD